MATRRRRRGGGGGGGGEELRWLTTYGDAVTLLLAFFVMLYAISQVDAQKFQLLVSGFETPFKNSAVVDGLLEMGDGLVGAAYRQSPNVEGLEVLPDAPDLGGFGDRRTGDSTYLRSHEELTEVRDALAGVLQAMGLDPEVGLRTDSRGLVVAIATDDVLFDSGSAELRPAGGEILASLVPILGGFANEVRVEGHTDTVPLNQNGYTNWNLSTDRALAVLELLEREGLNPTRLSATGYGEHRPIADNGAEEGRQRNRRVELVIVAEAPETPES
jgi:chemotaxis protein MotB